ncbi:cyclase family protein [Fulvimarina sp. MAC8]|uniref:cyclase family protein n=1 Tax=Fulvimarina sp. MAC8 TaxID=3162874 RepID=UPI0032EC3F25
MDIETLLKGDAELVDLTHSLRDGMPTWPTHPHYCQEVVETYERGDVALNHSLSLSEHTGTHFDAPRHFVKDAASILDLPLGRFVARMATIPATDYGPNGAVEPDRILAFERENGEIEAGAAVFFHFGWDRFWDDPADHANFLKDWPGLSGEASALLVARGVSIVGCDCLSIDSFVNEDFPAHRTLLEAGIVIGENFANLGTLPPQATLVALPLPIEGGSGAPTRAVAILDSAPEPDEGK